MFNIAQDFWKGLGSFWLHFENRPDIEAFWGGMLEALKESHRNLYKTAIGKFPKHSPDIWEHRYINFDLVWSGVEDNRINETNYFSLPDEYIGTFSIPTLSGINTGQILTQGQDFDIIDANKLYIYNLDSRLEPDPRYSEEKRVILFSDNSYRIDPQTFHLLRTMANTEILVPGQNIYFPFTYDGDQTLGEKVSDTVYASTTAYDNPAVALLNGNVMIFYTDQNDSGKLKFVIRDPEGALVVGPTTVDSNTCTYPNPTRMKNGNVMIAWTRNATKGKLAVIEPSGNILISAIDIPGTSASTDEFACVGLNNGNIFIGYIDLSDSTNTKFVIVSPTGTAIKSATTVTSYQSGYVTATLLKNNNVMIFYFDNSTRYGQLSIYDQDGSLIKSTITFNQSQTDEMHAITLTNGNVLLGFGSNTGGYLMVFSQTGHIVKTATNIYNSGGIYYIATSALRNGNGVIVFSTGDIGDGRFVVCDREGNILISSYQFAGSAYDAWVVTMANGQTMIAYDDGNNLDYGTLVVWDFIGPNRTHDYMVEKARLIKYMTWAIFYYRIQMPSIANLEYLYNILYNLPFAYESGEASISGLECTIGDYTYYLPSGENWGIDDGIEVDRFQPLTSGIEIKDRISHPSEIESEFGTLKDANAFILGVTASVRSNYDTKFVDQYEEDFINKAFNKVTDLF